jgi:putative ABC transport system permease protein
VQASALASAVPGARGFSNGLLPDGKALKLENVTQTDGVIISPAYFAAMRMPIVHGRAFTNADRDGAMLVVILNRTAAQMMWPGEEAVGKRLTSANPLGPTTVIGIAEDVRLSGPSEPAPPTFYVPFAQMNDEAWNSARAPFIVARTGGEPAALAAPVRRIVADIDRTMPLYNTMTMDERMAATVETARFNTSLLVMLGAAGALLAAVGIYGVIAYFAAQRTSEMGIRMALGATRRSVVWLVIRQAMWPVTVGVVVGAIGAAFASRAIATQLVGVDRTDPRTFIAVAAALVAVALLAAVIPARRAAALDPALTLRG